MASARTRWALAAAAVVLAGLLFGLERWLMPPSRALYEELVRSSTATADEVALLTHIVAAVAADTGQPARDVVVNGRYRSEQLNVALVDFGADRPRRENLPRDGMQAFAPNVLIVDLGMLRSILLQAFNDGLSFVMMLEATNGLDSPQEVVGVSSKFGAISLQLRLANLAHREEVEAHLGLLISQALVSDDLRDKFTYPFVFPIAHELYHLRHGQRAGLDVAAEELAADAFALEAAARRLARRADSAVMDDLLKRQLLFVGLRYFQDRLVADVFRDFRGLEASDLLASLLHDACNAAEAVSWPQRFNNPGVVVAGDQLRLPLLSDAEVVQLRQRLAAYDRRDHEHMLARIVRFVDLAARDPAYAQVAGWVFEVSRALLRLYRTGHADQQAFGGARSSRDAGGLTPAAVTAALGLQMAAVSAEGCEGGRCQLGFAGRAYVEMLGSGRRVQEIVMAVPPDAQREATALGELLGLLVGPRAGRAVQEQLVEDMAACGLASQVFDTDGYLVVIRTMNTRGWLELRAQAH